MDHDIVRREQVEYQPPARVGKIPKPRKLGNATRWRCPAIGLFIEAGSIRAFRRTKHG